MILPPDKPQANNSHNQMEEHMNSTPCSLQMLMITEKRRGEPICRRTRGSTRTASKPYRGGSTRLFTGYDNLRKRASIVKRLVNDSNGRLLSSVITIRRESNAMVIDGLDARSSHALMSAMHPSRNRVVVHGVNFDQRAAGPIQKVGAKPYIGRSTDFLTDGLDVGERLVLAYLDYTGTPSGNAQLNINPQEDMTLAISRMERYGFMLVTFSKRGETDADKYARQIIGDSGWIQLDEFHYCETSPMLLYLCCTPRTSLQTRECARRMYNPLRVHLNVPIIG